jgi:hypothetical protein
MNKPNISGLLQSVKGFPYLVRGFGGLVVIMLASGTQVRGFKPG